MSEEEGAKWSHGNSGIRRRPGNKVQVCVVHSVNVQRGESVVHTLSDLEYRPDETDELGTARM